MGVMRPARVSLRVGALELRGISEADQQRILGAFRSALARRLGDMKVPLQGGLRGALTLPALPHVPGETPEQLGSRFGDALAQALMEDAP